MRYWKTGSLVRVKYDFTVGPLAEKIAQGETGQIIDIDPETGDLMVQLSHQHESLKHWHNCIHLPKSNRAMVDLMPVWRTMLRKSARLVGQLLLMQPRGFRVSLVALLLSPAVLAINWLITFVALLPIGGNMIANAKLPPPYEIRALRAVPAVITIGERLHLIATSRYSRQCSAKLDRWIVRSNDHEVMHQSVTYNLRSELTPDFVEHPFDVDMPNTLPPDNYFYAATVHFVCPDGATYDIPVNPVHFKIVAAP